MRRHTLGTILGILGICSTACEVEKKSAKDAASVPLFAFTAEQLFQQWSDAAHDNGNHSSEFKHYLAASTWADFYGMVRPAMSVPALTFNGSFIANMPELVERSLASFKALDEHYSSIADTLAAMDFSLPGDPTLSDFQSSVANFNAQAKPAALAALLSQAPEHDTGLELVTMGTAMFDCGVAGASAIGSFFLGLGGGLVCTSEIHDANRQRDGFEAIVVGPKSYQALVVCTGSALMSKMFDHAIHTARTQYCPLAWKMYSQSGDSNGASTVNTQPNNAGTPSAATVAASTQENSVPNHDDDGL